MPLVYVHGIGNREERRAYDVANRTRDRFFRRFLPVPVVGHTEIRSPYWGEHGGVLRWKHASLPAAGLESLGAGGDFEAGIARLAAVPGAATGTLLTGTARNSMRDAVDLLFTVIDADSLDDTAADAVIAAAGALVEYCDQRERLAPAGPDRYPWLAGIKDDADLIDQLLSLAAAGGDDPEPDRESLGGRHRRYGRLRLLLRGGADRLRRAAGLPVETSIAAVRTLTGRPVSDLAGDVLTYLARRGTPDEPGPIVRAVLTDLREAAAEAGPDRPLVVVAHSMGGNIMYDLLTHFAPDLPVHTLVTVGSQVALFEELKLFRGSDPALPGPDLARIPRPAGLSRWINVVDRADLLGYRAGGVFDGVEDYVYPTSALWAHSAYFRQPHFYARLGRRL
ncbi:hypothetical protein [Actinoplanes couchii]|uniref:Uncharacterized protein n=1 Tax=Actinoplanes couchii TaxID=403638 RepID=A0ABQ3X815_9ACTN|nr:hypothetical protein [Actinoplanes couchii]MDR6320336.1 hypothetical protein [Actinoplanes couchii]GID54650.1 hypothetical protein Aco03nite_030540 [Actinoplanes couchii]